ncbi:ribonuclease III [Putridiphycobacter roseus]|uniref:Ribonuclease 3 n=1 Tax=Putridiphycobacter roseus TaxID=2219161 RepID=A0A2W1MXR3_9FLAO|nr:ribonuclease III [Putridiphycobacter roseus]PZE16617.1 ribonuclease III [Putridiphycobacter roseus]
MFQFLSKKKNTEELISLTTYVVKKTGYRPKNIQLFETAFSHKSYTNLLEGVRSNERLEFLGDRVIDLIVAEYLFTKFPNKPEGDLTKIKSKIVNRKMLAQIGEEMEMIDYIQYNKGQSININTIVGNAFEALIGAIYLDSDYQATKDVFNSSIIRKYINLTKVMEEEIDFKSTLIIHCQKNKLDIKYQIKEDADKDNDYTYIISAIINNKEWGIGRGKNKKTAEQAASKETLELFGME